MHAFLEDRFWWNSTKQHCLVVDTLSNLILVSELNLFSCKLLGQRMVVGTSGLFFG
jgi:hypothetical protein